MVAASITALIVIILFFLYLGWMYFIPALELFVNGILIYAVFLRSHAEIVKEKKYYFYLGGAAAAIVVYAIAGNFLESLLVWGFTAWLLLAFAFAQAGIACHFLYLKHSRTRHPRK